MPSPTRVTAAPRPNPAKPLTGVRIVSLALNLPGPAALQRLKALGARCLKVEPPGPPDAAGRPGCGDPMHFYDPAAYAQLHQGLRVLQLNLKDPKGQARLAKALQDADLVLTSFRPQALKRLGLDWPSLHRRWPRLSMVEIVGAGGAHANDPGHDLTYQAKAGLIRGTDLPSSLLADMAGGLLASEAALSVLLAARASGQGAHRQVSLLEAASWLGIPSAWTMTQPSGIVGGAHAGYRVYPCQDGRVALAALEPHFAAALFAAAGLPPPDAQAPFSPKAHRAIARWVRGQSCQQLDALAAQADVPLYTLPDRAA